jgi:DNA (cytosine-5)-methyltransferase 1
LIEHYLRLVSELRPKCFVVENVPGMASGKHRGLLDRLLSGFTECGYRTRVCTLNAAEFGVPQNRRRLFILGSRRDISAIEVPKPTTRPRTRNTRSSNDDLPLCPSVGDAIGDLPEVEEFDELLVSDELRSVAYSPWSEYAMRLRGDAVDADDFSRLRLREDKTLTGCARTGHKDDCRKRFATTQQGKEEPISRLHRLAWDGISVTLRSGTNKDHGAFSAPRPIHPLRSRAITTREAARLHSFPDWFQFHRTKWHGFRQIGNSVPPLLARAVGASVMKVLGEEPRKGDRIEVRSAAELLSCDMTGAAKLFSVSRRVIRRRRRKRRAIGKDRSGKSRGKRAR